MCTTKHTNLLEMCIVQHVEKECVLTFQSNEALDSTTLKSANLAVTCLIFHSRKKSQPWPYLVEMARIVMQKRLVATTQSLLFFEEISPAITIDRNWTWSAKAQNNFLYDLNVLNAHWLKKRIRRAVSDLIYRFSTYSQAVWSSHFPTKESSGLSTWVQTLWFRL